MSSKRAKVKTTKKQPQRATSNVFAMFDQSQIQEFKEAFNMIDQNRDGFIDKEDLHDMLASLGKNPTDEYLEGVMSEAPGPIDFTMFLTVFGEKLNGTDPEDVIAFACFDEEASGFIHEDHLRELLTTMGDRFTDEEVDEMYHEAPIVKKGNFNYVEFTRILKHGAKDKDNYASQGPHVQAPVPVTCSTHTQSAPPHAQGTHSGEPPSERLGSSSQ
ncbi:PREDICTED: myosin regulatory light polypeptide 9 [Myotis brandtii]|nr:PREDICTED: myosin regulatory light polypeptide 9 [Myotis brandtii]